MNSFMKPSYSIHQNSESISFSRSTMFIAYITSFPFYSSFMSLHSLSNWPMMFRSKVVIDLDRSCHPNSFTARTERYVSYSILMYLQNSSERPSICPWDIKDLQKMEWAPFTCSWRVVLFSALENYLRHSAQRDQSKPDKIYLVF